MLVTEKLEDNMFRMGIFDTNLMHQSNNILVGMELGFLSHLNNSNPVDK